MVNTYTNYPRSQSFSSVLVWTGENDTKTLVRMKIFWFIFSVMKMDTFENALVWMGPQSLDMYLSVCLSVCLICVNLGYRSWWVLIPALYLKSSLIPYNNTVGPLLSGHPQLRWPLNRGPTVL